MDLFPRIFDWLSDHEAGISAVAAIIVIAGVIFAGVRWLLLRGTGGRPQKLLVRPGRRSVLIAAGAGGLLLLAGAVAWLMLPDEPDTEVVAEEDPLLALPTGPVVAVLPFENLSRDPDQEFFSDGLTDGIITALSRFKDLFVIARNSTFRYKGQAVDVRQLRQELGAHYVVEGSVQRAGTALRVTVQLLKAKDGTHLWADTYDRELSASNVFAVQDEITEQVVATIAGSYGVISRARFAEVQEKTTESLDAYECVLRAASYFRDDWSVAEHARLRDALERAGESDPAYADLWAALSLIYLDEYRHGYNPRPDPLDRELEAARRAVALDPTSQTARYALAYAYFFRHDLDAFHAEAERTIALNPNNPRALAGLGTLLQNAGDEQGVQLIRKAMKLDPFHPSWYYLAIAFDHFLKGEYEEALGAARKLNLPNSFWPSIYLAAIYAELGRERDARSAVEDLRRLYPGFTIETYLEEDKKWNVPLEYTQHMVTALRKAGLPD